MSNLVGGKTHTKTTTKQMKW